MTLTVKLFATFRNGRFDVAERDVPSGATVGDVVDALRIPRPEVGVVLVGGRHAEMAAALSAGDTISIFPLVGGG